MYPFFVCALGDFFVLFVPVLRQIARYLPHHRTKNDSKTHPKSSHDKFKTASKWVKHKAVFGRLEVFAVLLSVPERVVRERMFRRAGKKEGDFRFFSDSHGNFAV